MLGTNHDFPPIELASKEGILAIGGDLHPDRLYKAYQQGIFPWYNEGEPIVWYSPDPRMVLKPKEVYISKSMRKLIRDEFFTVTFDKAFKDVLHQCKNIKRTGQNGTWITDELEVAMLKLHEMGHAKSVEIWQGDELAGGLYGIDIGKVFCGDSMFSLVSNASKFAFIKLAEKLVDENYKLIDCQVYNEHLASLGAYEIPRAEFKKYLPSF